MITYNTLKSAHDVGIVGRAGGRISFSLSKHELHKMAPIQSGAYFNRSKGLDPCVNTSASLGSLFVRLLNWEGEMLVRIFILCFLCSDL